MSTRLPTPKAVVRGTRHERVLSVLAQRDSADDDTLRRAANTRTTNTGPVEFERQVLRALRERGLIAHTEQWEWQITPEGRDLMRQLNRLTAHEADRAAGSNLDANPMPERPALNEADEHLLFAGQRRPCSHTDLMPPTPRPGSQDAERFPSRRGARLYYADGRVTDLLGRLIS